MSSIDPVSGHDETTVQRYRALANRLGTTIVADWTWPQTERAFAIQEAEAARAAAFAAIMAEISAVYERFPDAPTVGEACVLAGLDVDAINARLAAIPPPDDLGLQWLIGELEQAERRGSLLFVPVPYTL